MSFFTDDSFKEQEKGGVVQKNDGEIKTNAADMEKKLAEADAKAANGVATEDSRTSEVLEWIRDIVIAIVVAVIICQIIKPTIVKETSMLPNFHSNDYIFLSKIAYKFGGEPQHGDVVVFRTHSDSLLDDSGKHKLLIKRVIGLPGDEIRIADGSVFVNGVEDDQSYTKDGETWVSYEDDGKVLEMTVPEGTLFCMGDNREVSVDSRRDDVGCVDQDSIVGKAVFRLLPLSDIGVIHNVYDK